jgi:hypothetical protein
VQDATHTAAFPSSAQERHHQRSAVLSARSEILTRKGYSVIGHLRPNHLLSWPNFRALPLNGGCRDKMRLLKPLNNIQPVPKNEAVLTEPWWSVCCLSLTNGVAVLWRRIWRGANSASWFQVFDYSCRKVSPSFVHATHTFGENQPKYGEERKAIACKAPRPISISPCLLLWCRSNSQIFCAQCSDGGQASSTFKRSLCNSKAETFVALKLTPRVGL